MLKMTPPLSLITTFFAADFEWSPVLVAALGLGGPVLTGLGTWLVMRRVNTSSAAKNNTDAIISIGNAFRDLLTDFDKVKRQALSAEETHSLERIASREKLAELENQVEKCEREHQDWAECRADMLTFLMGIEPQLRTITGTTTLVNAVQSLKKQIEDS